VAAAGAAVDDDAVDDDLGAVAADRDCEIGESGPEMDSQRNFDDDDDADAHENDAAADAD
jgi:hypothetical protein